MYAHTYVHIHTCMYKKKSHHDMTRMSKVTMKEVNIHIEQTRYSRKYLNGKKYCQHIAR